MKGVWRTRLAALGALLAALVLVLVLLARAGGAGDTYEVVGVFESANGLVRTGEVRVANQRVGRITNITVEPGGYPEVTMEIDADYRLRVGAMADVRLASQAGQLNRYIALENGDGEPLEDGAKLGLARTSEPVELDDLLSALTPKTRGEVRRLLTGATKALDRQGPNIDRALRHSARALAESAELFADIGSDRAALPLLVDRAEAAAAAVAARPAELEATVSRLAAVLDLTARRHGEVAASLRELPGTLRVQRSALARFEESIPTIRAVAEAARKAAVPVRPLAEELSRTVPLALPLFQSGRRLVRAWIPNGDDVEKLFAGLAPLLEDLDPVLGGLNPILETWRVRAPEMLGWLPLLGDAAASYDAAGHAVRVIGGISEAPRRLVESSDCSGGWLRRPFDRTPGALECEPWEDYADTFVAGAEPADAFLTPEETAVRDTGLGP